jgi:hypothetical protein
MSGLPDPPPPPFTLNQGERATPLWSRLKVHLKERLEETRRRNGDPQTPDETLMLRGEIRLLKRLLLLDEDEPARGFTLRRPEPGETDWLKPR